jgi:hypothetical protein
MEPEAPAVNEQLPKEKLNPVETGHFDDISVDICGDCNTVLIEDRFPPARLDDNVAHAWLTIDEARGLRDWLNKALT